MANPIPARTSQHRNLTLNNIKKISKEDILYQTFTQDIEIIDNQDKTLSLKINGEIVELKSVFEKICEKRHWFGKTLTQGAVYLALTLYHIKEGLISPDMKIEIVFRLIKTFLIKFDVELPQEKDSLARFERFKLSFDKSEYNNHMKVPLVRAYHSLLSSTLDNANYLDHFKAGTPYERVRILKELKNLNGFPSCSRLAQTKQLASHDPQVSKEFDTYLEYKIKKEGLRDIFDELHYRIITNTWNFEEIVTTLELKTLISEKYRFKLTSFLKPQDVNEYSTLPSKRNLIERLIFTIDCSAPATQFALACAVNDDEFLGPAEFLEKLVGYIFSIKWTNIKAIELIIEALQQHKFGLDINLPDPNSQLDVAIKHSSIFNMWIANTGAASLLQQLQSRKFRTVPIILMAIAQNAAQIVGKDQHLQQELLKFIESIGFGTDEKIIDALLVSLTKIEWAQNLNQLLIAKALHCGVAGMVTDINLIVTGFEWTEPQAQEEIALALRWVQITYPNTHLSDAVKNTLLAWNCSEFLSKK